MYCKTVLSLLQHLFITCFFLNMKNNLLFSCIICVFHFYKHTRFYVGVKTIFLTFSAQCENIRCKNSEHNRFFGENSQRNLVCVFLLKQPNSNDNDHGDKIVLNEYLVIMIILFTRSTINIASRKFDLISLAC